MRHCEVYDFFQQRWFEMAPMNKPRCTFSAMVFMGYIYTFGGYTNQFERSKKVKL